MSDKSFNSDELKSWRETGYDDIGTSSPSKISKNFIKTLIPYHSKIFGDFKTFFRN